MKQKHSIQEIKVLNISSLQICILHKWICSVRVSNRSQEIHHFYISLKAFSFPDEVAVAEHHFKELGRELKIQEENKSSEARSEPNKPTQIEIEV